MAQSQYNFKIEDELKEEAELLSQDFQSKQEFLTVLLESYKTVKSNNTDTNIDMTKYESIDAKTKSVLSDAFKHIIYTLQQNTSSTKQQLLTVDTELKAIADERESFKRQIDTLTSKNNQQLINLQKENEEKINAKDTQISKGEDIQNQQVKHITDIELKNKELQLELEQVKMITGQVESIINENSLLRKEILELNTSSKAIADATTLKIKELNDLLSLKEKEAYRADMEYKNLQKAIEDLKAELKAEKATSNKKNLEIKSLEKENIILSTKLEMKKD